MEYEPSNSNVSRRPSSLQKLVEAVAAGADGVKWNHVLHYLRAHCKARDDDNEATGDMVKQSLDDSDSNGTKNRSNKTKPSSKSKHSVQLDDYFVTENPLPDYYIPTPELKQELWIDKSRGDSILRLCVPVAPSKVIAALCFLLPEALKAADTQNRVALHYACRYPVCDQLDSVMKVLVSAHPAALIHRDDDGRTPLHYLFWFHGRARKPEIVSLFCQTLSSAKTEFYKIRQPVTQKIPQHDIRSGLSKLERKEQQALLKEKEKKFPLPEIPKPGQSNKVPYTAAIIPDSAHGCCPLHYAVMEGASLDAIQMLYQSYPQAKHSIDRYGRTPLHWYLGAGSLDMWCNDFPLQHVSGEEVQPDCQNECSFDRVIDPEVVLLLLSSRVARTADFQQRYPLHWATVFLAHNYTCSAKPGYAMSLKTIVLLLDHFVGQLICVDDQKMTPAMMMFDTVGKIQLRASEKEDNKQNFDLVSGGLPQSLFDPPEELLEMLLKHPDPTANANVAAMEDSSGRLLVHAALEVASSPRCIDLLIRCHPTALIHTAEETLFVPLHSAFCHKHTAKLQNSEIVMLLLQSMHAGRNGTLVDGRLAMKMEDVAGYYPIHYATQNGACLDVIKTLVGRYPNTALLATPFGDLPVHCVITESLIQAAIESRRKDRVESDDTNKVKGENEVQQGSVTPELIVARDKICTLLRPLLSNPSKLVVADHVYGMIPLHCAILFGAADYQLLLTMLKMCPQSATTFSKGKYHYEEFSLGSCSALDLHEICDPDVAKLNSKEKAIDIWQRKRELLFSFCPTLESHRHREELLDQCVRALIDELGEPVPNQSDENLNYRYHLRMSRSFKDQGLQLDITHSVSNMEREVLQSFGFINSRPPRQNLDKPVLVQELNTKPSTMPVLDSPQRKNDSRDKKPKKKNKSGKRQLRRKNIIRKNSSVYDDENTSLGCETFTEWYETGGDESESVFSGVDTDEQYSSDAYDSQDEAYTHKDDDCSDQGSEGDIFSGEDASRSLGYTTSGSRLRTTFEERSCASDDDDDSQSDDDDDDDDDESRSFTDDTGTRRSFDEESTILSRRHTKESGKKNAFDTLKDNLEAEEKKEEYIYIGAQKAALNTPRTNNSSRKLKVKPKPKTAPFERPEYISEVAMRIWTFFALYCDPNNPNDNYVKQIGDIIDEIKFSTVEKLVSIPLPPYAQLYIDAEETEELTFRDVASPKCRELIHKTCYFAGRYELQLNRQEHNGNKSTTLVHRATDGSSVTIRALEWLFTTEEMTSAHDAGVAVENIWATGEIPPEIGVTFQCRTRPVWITFSKDKCYFENEVESRRLLGVSVDEDEVIKNTEDTNDVVDFVIPLLDHFCALNPDRKRDRTYNVDINDERFNVLDLLGDCKSSDSSMLRLGEYPFALVYPAPQLGGSLSDHIFQHGLNSNSVYSSSLIEENWKICVDVSRTVALMHKKGVCLGDISIRNVSKYVHEGAVGSIPKWCFSSLSVSSSIGTSYLGGISEQGYAQFHTETLPPEMFAWLSPLDLKVYRNYWENVQEIFQITIDPSIIEPIVDLVTGESYVVKCHFIPLTNKSEVRNDRTSTIPALPYDLIPYSVSADLWSLGKLIFLLTSGRPLLPVDIRGTRLLEYANLCKWTPEPMIYEYIIDPMAQDVLLSLLTRLETREKMNLDDILNHPFFAGQHGCSTIVYKQIAEKRRIDCAAYKRDRMRKVRESFDENWLSKRTDKITCWDFEVLERIYLSPSEISKRMSPVREACNLPCNFFLLPYKVSPGVPLTDEELYSAERCGEAILHLSKACYFTSVMKQSTAGQEESILHKWSSSEMLRVLDLSSDEFGDIQSEMAELAAIHVESFRTNPISIALKIVQSRIKQFFACFDDKEMYLYLVDEFSSLPILEEQFPMKIPDEWRLSVLQNGLLSVHLCSLHARGVAKGVTGLLHLIYNDSETAIPPCFAETARGLNHKLDEIAFIKEMQLLQDALSDLYATKHRVSNDNRVIYDFLAEVDPSRNMASVRRVICADATLWTTPDGSQILRQVSETLSFQDALRRSRKQISKLKEYKQKVDVRVSDGGEALN